MILSVESMIKLYAHLLLFASVKPNYLYAHLWYNVSMNIKRRGRPSVENPATERLPMIRLTPEQLKAYKQVAELEGLSFAAWAKTNLDRIAKRKLKNS